METVDSQNSLPTHKPTSTTGAYGRTVEVPVPTPEYGWGQTRKQNNGRISDELDLAVSVRDAVGTTRPRKNS